MTDPMWESPTEPRTMAGRRLIASFPANAADASRPEFVRHVAQSILAIEAEAARAAVEARDRELRAVVVALPGLDLDMEPGRLEVPEYVSRAVVLALLALDAG